MAAAFIGSLTPDELGALAGFPAATPPPGVVPNFVDPESQKRDFYAVTGILFGIMFILFLNRLYVKLFKIQKYSWDDWTIVLAVISSIAYYTASIWAVEKGRIGTHQWDINIPQVLSLNLLVSTYLLSLLTEVALLFAKVTFFLMYLDIFRPMRWMRILSILGTIITIAFYVGIFIANFILTTPLHGETWAEVSLKTRSLTLAIPQAAVGLALDLYILVLPMVAISMLQLTPRRRLGVNLIFMSGAVACVASVLKIYYSNLLNHTPDITWATLPVQIVTLGELAVGISCACMPCVAYTFQRHVHSFTSSIADFASHLRSSKHGASKPPSTSSGRDLISEKPSSIPEAQLRLETPFVEDEPGFSEVLMFIRGERQGRELEEGRTETRDKSWDDSSQVGVAI